jgi:molecular chaperone GrpE
MSENDKKDWTKIAEGEDMLSDEMASEEADTNEADEDSAAPASDIPAGILEHPSYKELENKLTESEKLVHENWDKALRAMSELENIQRRTSRELENAHKYGTEKLLSELLPILDSLEQAMASDTKEPGAHQAVIEGVQLTLKLFADVLAKFGVNQLDPMGEPFDPQKHEAMSMQETTDVPANTVLMVFQKGYQLHERIIRPARVVVSKGGTKKIDEKA